MQISLATNMSKVKLKDKIHIQQQASPNNILTIGMKTSPTDLMLTC